MNAVTGRGPPPYVPALPHFSPTPKLILSKAPPAIHGIALPIIATLSGRRSLTLVASRRRGCWSGWIRSSSSAPSSHHRPAPSPARRSLRPHNEAGSRSFGVWKQGAKAKSTGSSPPRRRAEDPGPAVHRGAPGLAGAPFPCNLRSLHRNRPNSDPGEARSGCPVHRETTSYARTLHITSPCS